jgi:hypothetical protein
VRVQIILIPDWAYRVVEPLDDFGKFFVMVVGYYIIGIFVPIVS